MRGDLGQHNPSQPELQKVLDEFTADVEVIRGKGRITGHADKDSV